MTREIYRKDPEGEPDYDGYEEIPDEEIEEYYRFLDSFNI